MNEYDNIHSFIGEVGERRGTSEQYSSCPVNEPWDEYNHDSQSFRHACRGASVKDLGGDKNSECGA
jgi:hypothetical protein